MALILLVEDEEVQRRAFEAMLRSADHQVLLAGNGAQALLIAQDKKPDMILTDIGMPKMDGKALCQGIRSTPDLDGMYIIVITALEGEAHRVESLLAGADDFLRKPVQREDLLHRVGIGVAVRAMRREMIDLRTRAAAATQAQDALATCLDTALRGMEDALATINTGDAVAAMNHLRSSYEAVRNSLSRISPPEG